MLDGIHTGFGFAPSVVDMCMYIIKEQSKSLLFELAVHVDDITGADLWGAAVAEQLTATLSNHYGIASATDPALILGMQIELGGVGRQSS